VPDSILLRLVLYMAPLSFLTVGGGQTILAELHRQVVDVQGWLTDQQFLEVSALTRRAPGPGRRAWR
jgi:chromate transporter